MVIRFAETLVFFALMAAVVVAALNQAGVHTTSLTALLAAAAVGVGLAVKDSLANLAAGVMILFFRPYTMHQFVDAGGASGSVEEVQMFSTVLRTPDNLQVIVPNSAILRSNIRNYSAYDTRRIDLPVSIRYEDSLGTARDRLLSLTTSHPLVLSDPKPTVEVVELAANSVNLVARPWVSTPDYAQVRSELLEQIKLHLYESVFA